MSSNTIIQLFNSSIYRKIKEENRKNGQVLTKKMEENIKKYMGVDECEFVAGSPTNLKLTTHPLKNTAITSAFTGKSYVVEAVYLQYNEGGWTYKIMLVDGNGSHRFTSCGVRSSMDKRSHDHMYSNDFKEEFGFILGSEA